MARYPDIEDALAHTERALRLRGRTEKTIRTYLGVLRRFLFFHRNVPPEGLGQDHLERYLMHLTEDRKLPLGTRNQAATALVYFFERVLGTTVDPARVRSRTPSTAPVVFSHAEATAVIAVLPGKYRLIGGLLYGTGLRLGECMRLRTKDLDFELLQVTVREGKGRKDRFTVMPVRLVNPLRAQIRRVEDLNRRDRAGGAGWAPLPGALHRKEPRAGYELGWQFLFPASRLSTDAVTGRRGRRHLHPTAVQRQVKGAIRRAGVTKPASTHTFRHTFATQILRDGCDPRTVQQLLGHSDIRVTMQYLHAVRHTGLNVRSPLDRPDIHE